MIALQIVIWVVFVVMISIQVYFWCGYIYTRFSKRFEEQRKAIRLIAKLASNPDKSLFKKKNKEEPKDVNRGYG